MSSTPPARGAIVIVSYNSAAHLAPCLESLEPSRGEWEVVVVDNGSRDASRALVRDRFPWVRLVEPAENLGFAGGCNRGARAAGAAGEYLLFLNPDTVVFPGALDALVRTAEAHGAAAVGGNLVNEDGSFQAGFAARRYPSWTFLAFDLLLVNRIFPRNPAARRADWRDFVPDRDREIEQPAGACFLVRRDTFERVGGFDERFHPLWFEDVDLAQRIRAAGGTLWFSAGARVQHATGHSIASLSATAVKGYWYANLIRYARKHYSPRQAAALRGLVGVGSAARALLSLFQRGGAGAALGQLRVAWAALRSGDVRSWYH